MLDYSCNFFSKNACRFENSCYICTRNTKVIGVAKYTAKIAQLVERHLAKVEVAGSNPVFRSAYYQVARVVELVDTLDLKSSGQ